MILALFLFLVVDLNRKDALASDELPKSPQDGQVEFDKFIDEKTNQVMGSLGPGSVVACPASNEQIVDKVSKLASIISDAVTTGEQSEKFKEALTKELNIEDLVETTVRHNVKVKGTGRRPIGSLEDDFIKKGIFDSTWPKHHYHISHADRRLGSRGLDELKSYGQAKVHHYPVVRHIVTSSEYYSQHNGVDKVLTKNGKNEMANWIKVSLELPKAAFHLLFNTILKSSVFFLDQLYSTPHFLEYLPLVGEAIILLKERGKPAYNIVKAIRSSKKAIESGLISYNADGQLVTAPRANVKLLNEVGTTALQFLVVKLLSKNPQVKATTDNFKEVLGRCVYFIMMQIAPKTAQCILNI